MSQIMMRMNQNLDLAHQKTMKVLKRKVKMRKKITNLINDDRLFLKEAVLFHHSA